MKHEEAGDVITLIQAATNDTRVSQDTITYFTAALTKLDYHMALDSAAMGVAIWRRFPTWSEFREFYKARERQSRPTGIDQPEGKPPKHPEWVWVWTWARNRRSPRNLRPFPQQRDFADPDTLMSDEEYETLRQEWENAGSPKAENPIVLAKDSQI